MRAADDAGEERIELHGQLVPATKLGGADEERFQGPVYLVQSGDEQWALVTKHRDGGATSIYGLYASEQEARDAYQRALKGEGEEPVPEC